MKDARAAIPKGIYPSAPVVSAGRVYAGRRWWLPILTAVVSIAPGRLPAQLHPPDIILLSENARGESAEGRSEAPAVNMNGLVAAYSSDALNLVSPPSTNTRNQVYARDVDVVTSDLVSKSVGGTAGDRASQNSGFPPGISAEGRFIAFSSLATNLVPDDTGGLANVFVYDRELGAIELISRGVDGPSDGSSTLPKLSADARFVVFQSTATNLVHGDDNGVSDIFLYDRVDKVMQRVSLARAGGSANGPSITAAISEDGHFVAFASRATNLVDETTTGTFEQIFITDWENQITQLVSVSTAGAPANAISFLPDLSSNGSQVAFKSEAFNLVPNDTNGVPDVFVRDRTTSTTQRVSVDSFGNQSNGLSGGPGISGDGRFVAFASFSSNFVPEDGNGFSDVYVYDRFPPDRPQGQIARVTVGIDGQQPNNGVADFPVTISADGRWIGFASAASNLVPNDVNNDMDAFLACNPFDAFDCAPPTPTPTVDARPCVGDCNGDGVVTIVDLVRMVNIALDRTLLCPNDLTDGCLAGDANCDCEITVDEIVRAVQNLLLGCHDFGDCGLAQHEQLCCEAPLETRTATATPTITPTRTITPTPPVTATASATPTGPQEGVCVGDCNDDGMVSITDLVRMVVIALGQQPICPTDGSGGCLAGDADCNCEITVEEIVQAVRNTLHGCTIFNTCPDLQMMCCGS